MDTSKYKTLYLQEVSGHLSGIESGLLALEKNPSDSAAIDQLFRFYHSIKGMSASMGYMPIMKLAHAQEDLLSSMRSGTLRATAALISALLQCLDALKKLVSAVEQGAPLNLDTAPYIDWLKGLSSGADGPPSPADLRMTAPATGDQPLQAGMGKGAPTASNAHVLRLSGTMRVEAAVFDELLSAVGGLYMGIAGFKDISKSGGSIALKDAVHGLETTANRLYAGVLSARMLPVSQLIEGLPRIVRDLASKGLKQVELKIEDTGISLDRTILEGLGSPLVHIIRNAVDHGIEPLDERKRLGKPALGSITLSVDGGKNRVAVVISDNGRGIDRRQVLAKAAQKGIPAPRLMSLTDKEVLSLICLPGLSTKEGISETSGRGVGMDAVKNAIEALGGTVDIESESGKGTKITLDLPRTTSIIKALSVRVSDELFLLPLSAVVKVVEAAAKAASGASFAFEGAQIPLIPLASAVGLKEIGRREIYTVVVAEAGNHSGGGTETAGNAAAGLAAFRVDDFVSEFDAYINPLLPPMSRLKGVSGITVMGDGRPVFLLDLPYLIAKAREMTGGGKKP
ncbi:MAG: Hpt domain-containing protein [Deltaproteobacteria bacterium]|nr:Hpt domain-containing protein [Deltaproteobacteria bacterium]